MSRLDRIRTELKVEESTLAEGGEAPLDPQFEIDLGTALKHLEPSDAFVEAIAALAPMTPSTTTSRQLAVELASTTIGLADLRVQHGLSEAEAARMLDVSRDSLESLEFEGWHRLDESPPYASPPVPRSPRDHSGDSNSIHRGPASSGPCVCLRIPTSNGRRGAARSGGDR